MSQMVRTDKFSEQLCSDLGDGAVGDQIVECKVGPADPAAQEHPCSGGDGAQIGDEGDELLLQSFRPPDFIPPYPLKVNPHASSQSAIRELDEWLQSLKLGMAFGPKILALLLKTDIPALAARVYPDASEWGFQWATKLFYLIWVLDDYIDSTDAGQSPDTLLSLLLEFHLVMMWSFPEDHVLRQKLTPFLSALPSAQEREEKGRLIQAVLADAKTLPGTVYPGEVSTVGALFRDVWGDAVSKRTASESVLRFGHTIQHWLLGGLMETQDRETKAGPRSIPEYIELRRRTSATRCALVAVDIINGLDSLEEWYNSEAMQQLLDATNDFASWDNDIWSFKKEVLVNKEVFNVVLLISLHNRVSYADAAVIVTQMMTDRITDLERAAADLECITPRELRHCFLVYRETCRCMVSTTHEWHSKSARYQ